MNSLARFSVSAVFAIAAAMSTGAPRAQDYPSKPIRLIVGFAPGGSADAAARVLEPKLSELLRQPVIIDNRPGGGGSVATSVLIKSPADGYTIMYATVGALSVNQFLSKLAYDPLAEVAPISMGTEYTNILVVNSQSSIKSLADYVRSAKQPDSMISFGSAGIGSIGHLAGEMLRERADLHMEHIPYRSGGLASNDLMGGNLASMFGSPIDALAQIAAGRMRPLATTGARRHEALPNVPTLAESGFPGFEALNWSAFIAPKDTPPAVIRQLNVAIVAALSDPGNKAQLKKMGLDPFPSSPEQAGAYFRREADKWGAIVKDANIKAQ